MKVSTNRKSTVDEGSLDQYLRDISVFPLITREMEVELAIGLRELSPSLLSGAIPIERTRSPYDLPTALGDLTSTISALDTSKLSSALTFPTVERSSKRLP